ncbi:hypothetical protein VTJ49DRAFT_7546 [Mycothermus thermophilus]|uniref:Uncharacterized protein n=1 Tax=Humicola insolens TaxID=85995 RepID=A0ABR3VHJ5_HUMIN
MGPNYEPGVSTIAMYFPKRTSLVIQGEILSPTPYVELRITPYHRDFEALTHFESYARPYIMARVQLLFHGDQFDGMPVPITRYYPFLKGTTTVRAEDVTMVGTALSMVFAWHDLRIIRQGWFRLQVTFLMCHSGGGYQPYAVDEEEMMTIDVGEEFYVRPAYY